jgi:hypothetical protein
MFTLNTLPRRSSKWASQAIAASWGIFVEVPNQKWEITENNGKWQTGILHLQISNTYENMEKHRSCWLYPELSCCCYPHLLVLSLCSPASALNRSNDRISPAITSLDVPGVYPGINRFSTESLVNH